jgi:hypothetical protein
MRNVHVALSLAALSHLGACSSPREGGGERVGQSASAVTATENGVVEYAFPQYRKSAAITLASYATPDAVGSLACGAAMIGPNTMISAAHCGPASQVDFRTYHHNTGDLTQAVTSTYSCTYLVQTFNGGSDLMIHFCNAGADGVNPGDRYGYLDLDPTRPTVGQEIYSLWTNQQPSEEVPVALMYSPGQITRTNLSPDELWSVPHQAGSVGIESNVYGEGGSSGSPQLDAFSHKIVVGPTSTAVATGARERRAVSIYDYLYWGNAQPGGGTSDVNESAVTAMGLDPQNYYGWIDKDLDWSFDIQSDVEVARGEQRRNWYYLGFESARRNKLWTPVDPYATFANGTAVVTRSDDSEGPVLMHQMLNLVKGANYVLSGVAGRTAGDGFVWVGLVGEQFSGAWLPGDSPQPFAIPVVATHDNTEVMMLLSGNGTYEFSRLLLVRVDNGGINDFDMADERISWTDGGSSGPAMIVPDGRDLVGGAPNWAAYVASFPGTTPHTARLDRVPAALGTKYRVCFDQKFDQGPGGGCRAGFELVCENGCDIKPCGKPVCECEPISPPPPPNVGHATISGAASTVDFTFDVGSDWSTVCQDTDALVVPMTIEVGVQSGAPFLVDNVTFTALP